MAEENGLAAGLCSWPERRFPIPSDHEALLLRDSLDNPPDPPGHQGIGDRLDLPQQEQVIPRQGRVFRAGTPSAVICTLRTWLRGCGPS